MNIKGGVGKSMNFKNYLAPLLLESVTQIFLTASATVLPRPTLTCPPL